MKKLNRTREKESLSGVVRQSIYNHCRRKHIAKDGWTFRGLASDEAFVRLWHSRNTKKVRYYWEKAIIATIVNEMRREQELREIMPFE